MKRNPFFAAMAVVILLAPSLSFAGEYKDGSTPAVTPYAQPVGGFYGTTFKAAPTDGDGNFYFRPATPNMVVINHKSNVTLANSATPDTSSVPFAVSQYRQLFLWVRVKAASFAATGYLEVAARQHSSAQSDSTALGWPVALGTGTRRGGKTVRLTTLDDRWKSFALVDSLAQTPFQAQYMSLQIFNFTGAQIIYDVWLLGIPW